MNKPSIKSAKELEIMRQGGKRLHEIKLQLMEKVKVGTTAREIDTLAEKLILKNGGKPSFKMVEGYKWSTCVNLNQGIVHGIPHKSIFFKSGDLVSIDLGMFYNGFHTDTSVSVSLDPTPEVRRFLYAGKEAFRIAVNTIIPNRSYVYDISKNIQDTLFKYGYNPVLDLTGHGIGKNLHEEPYIPCFVDGDREKTPKILSGIALAVEVMYTAGKPELIKETDGWTISTKDGKISGLFEDTVIVTDDGFQIIT